MTIKEKLLDQHNIEAGRFGKAIKALAEQNAAYRRAANAAEERLRHLISELEAVLHGEQKKLRPFRD